MYVAGRIPFVELLDTQRTLLDAWLALAQLRTEREKALAVIETWSAVDVEAMRATPLGGGGGGMQTRPGGSM
jgi:hypothetical protein